MLDAVVAPAPLDELLDRDHGEPLGLGELHGTRQAHHRAVVVDEFDDHRDRGEARESAQVDRRLGVAVTLEHAARSGAQREDVTGARQRRGRRRRVGEQTQRQCAVGGRDAGVHAVLRINGDRVRGALRVFVARDHRRKEEPVGHVVRYR